MTAKVKIGVVILAHKNHRRSLSLAEYLDAQGCAVHVHFDKTVGVPDIFHERRITTSSEFVSNWGGFGLVDASLHGARALIDHHDDLTHIALLSESCIPTSPISDLAAHLADRPETDFITCRSLIGDDWIGDGLSEERITLSHPYSFRTQRRLFDLNVAVQRMLKVHRKIPGGLTPFAGDQWWCLRVPTLKRIFQYPRFADVRDFMLKSWIPDELFFQTMVRALDGFETQPSLTFAEFDRLGKPYTFYDDHLEVMKTLPGFFARKVWHGADKIYDYFLGHQNTTKPDPEFRMRSLADPITRQVINMGTGTDVRNRFYRLTDRPFTVFVGFQAANSEFSETLVNGFDVSHYPRFFTRRHYGGQVRRGPGNITISPAHLVHNPHALLSNLLAADQHRHVTLCLDPGDHHGLWSTVLRTQKAHIVFLKDHWKARLDGETRPLRKARLKAVYDKLVEPGFQRMMRAKFTEIEWEEYQNDILIPIRSANLIERSN